VQLVNIVVSVKWSRNIYDICYWQGEKEVRYIIQLRYRALRDDHHDQCKKCFRYLWNL